jgi:hypothetical protein
MIGRAMLCSAPLLLSACLPTEGSVSANHALGMARWEALAPANYEMVVERHYCECLPEWLVPVRVTVRDDEIESVVHALTGEPVVPGIYHAMTVNELFGVIDQARATGAHRIAVDYDRVLGYPRSIAIDYSREAVDDELSLTVSELRAVD